MKNKFSVFFLFILLGFVSCNKDKAEKPAYNRGQLTVYTDESFKSVVEALADGYMTHYPETKILVKTKKEDLGFLDLLNDKAKLIVMSRDLSKDEVNEYEKRTQLKFIPAPFAADGVVFIVPKDSPQESISLDDIKIGLESDSKPFIFDGTNSSNLNFVAEKIHKKPGDLKFSIINGNENLIQELKKYPGKIGVIGYNSISRPFNDEMIALRSQIKMLPIIVKGKSISISQPSLRSLEYPFTRIDYFLNNEGGFNIASGFIRFSCTQIGQKIVEKEGLQPYNLYKREVQMH